MLEPVRVGIFWHPQGLMGPASSVIDALHSLQALAQMRQPRSAPPVVWRWLTLPGLRAPTVDRSDLTHQRFPGAADVMVLPGWQAHSGPHLDALVNQSESVVLRLQTASRLVAVGNGLTLAAAAGWLNGRQAVAPWAFVSSLLRRAPDAALLTDRAWTVNERLWSCAAPVHATEIFLDALGDTPVQALAASAAHVLLHTPERQSVARLVVKETMKRPVSAGSVERARRWLQAHMAEPYSLAQLSAAAAASPRTLLRHFEIEHGQSPYQYQHSLRMAKARVMLETTYQSIEQVAQACGYKDIGTFRRQFFKQTGQQPAAYRESNQLRTSRRRWKGT
jgi:transcriptional regulator GlxA family with amidase domain